ncbi:SGNH/GDSL hydrolase family protein [Micromonospora sp. DT81.3]|uniref:SGNH/GDSL hydrolase family protein n=1 Tax=Micromonospora sp. DT81.3 TaxID=3416523 RepID=UPI003CE84457
MKARRSLIGTALAAVISVALSGCAGGATGVPVDLEELETPAAIVEVTSIGALGDSVTLGINACAEPGRCTASSWATGDDPAVASVALRAGKVSGTFPKVVNKAKDGGTVADALARVDEIITEQPGLVLLLLGGNDVCKGSLDEMTTPEDFRTSYSALLSQLHTGIPKVQILAMSIPDLHRIWEIGHDNGRAVRVWDQSPSCRNLLGDAQVTDAAAEERRDAVARRNAELNAVIQELCTSAVGCVGDGGALFGYEFEPDEISTIDYFHPSVAGEAVIADLAWTAVQKAGTQ